MKEVDGEKRLVLDHEISRMSTTGLLAKAAGDYNALLPSIARTSVPEGSKLILKPLTPTDDHMHIVSPPEGWSTLYVTVRQADRMLCSDTVLRYNATGEGFVLMQCTTAHWFKGE